LYSEAEYSERIGMGNCGEMKSFAIKMIHKLDASLYTYQIDTETHQCTLLAGEPLDDPGNPNQWNHKTVVLDGWLGRVCIIQDRILGNIYMR
jgi:hypothetical protein